MINALGLLEVDGMVAAIDAADAMLKAANVRLLSHEVLDPGRLTLVVEGDLAACRAALDAGCAAAMRTGRVISRKEIGRPDDDTQWLVTGFNRQPKQPVREPDAPVIVAESADELLALLTSVRQGMTAGEVAAHFGWPLEKARNADYATLCSILTAVLPQINTSVTIDDLLPFAKNISKYYIGETAGFPFDRQGMDVGKLDCVVPVTLESNAVKLHEFLYPDESYTPSSQLKEISDKIISVTGLDSL